MWTLRVILILVGAAALAALYFYLRRHPPRRGRGDESGVRSEPEWHVPGDNQSGARPAEPSPAVTAGAMRARAPVKPEKARPPSAADHGEPAAPASTAARLPAGDEVFALGVAFPDGGVDAKAVVHRLGRLDCRPGKDGIYHFEDARGRALYHIANLFEPGVLEPLPETASLRGLVLFFAGRADRDDAHAFERMLGAARDIAGALDGRVQDARHRPLTAARELELKLAAAHHV